MQPVRTEEKLESKLNSCPQTKPDFTTTTAPQPSQLLTNNRPQEGRFEQALLQMAIPRLINYALSSPWFTSFDNWLVQNTVGDLPALISDSDKFLTTELYARAADTGVAQAYIGSRILCLLGWLPTITMINGDRDLVSQVPRCDDDDPASRDSFHIVQDLLGVTTMANMLGAEATEQRQMIKHRLAPKEALNEAYQFTFDLIENHFQKWDDTLSVQDNFTYISANIIGRCVFGIPEVPMKYTKLIQKAGSMVTTPPSAKEVTEIAKQIKAMSDELLSHEDASKYKGYPLLQLNLTGNESAEEVVDRLKKLNAGSGIVVEGNTSFLLTSAILLVSQNSEVQNHLRDELKDFDWHQQDAAKALCELEYLDCVYTESLRYSSPTGMLDRQVSKPYAVKGKKDQDGYEPIYHIAGQSLFTPLLGNSHMMVSISSIHRDKKHWGDDANVFNPSRFAGEDAQEKKKYLMPFSVGKRPCPAGGYDNKGFVATVSKLVIAYFTMHHDLELHSELKPLPNDSIYRRWEEMFASVQSR